MQSATTDRDQGSTSLLTSDDVYYFREGTASRLADKLGAHPASVDGVAGTHFAVWAPNARAVSVVGDFNGWRAGASPLTPRHDQSGIWEGFVAEVGHGATYKYHVISRHKGYAAAKADPFARYAETPPATASRVWSLDYDWQDQHWMASRGQHNALNAPMAVYEVHPGSWRRNPEEGDRPLTWRELAEPLADYVVDMGFTHVELMPVMEHPFYGSWGYQVTGYYAPSARYGTPQDLMHLIDHLHQRGVGVILDWVPSHFPTDEHGLGYFDGTHLYEHADPRQGFHPEWGSCIFNYGRNEVRAFLVSNALFWLRHYHADGLRVDAVASMLYLDYARQAGEWVPNEHGGRENLAAVTFLRHLNEAVYREFPDVQTIAEESTAWPQVSRPVYLGGLGFGLKWNMGWMHDTLDYFGRDPLYRSYHHNAITFSVWYAFNENFTLPLSHDEVVHGKGSLINKLPGDEGQKFAGLRAMFGYMYAHPGKKLLFMGGEFGQWREWNHDRSLDWHLLEDDRHRGLSRWVRDLNLLYRDEPALHRQDFDRAGFEWVDASDSQNSVLSFLRHAGDGEETLLVVCNFTPVLRRGYRVGVPASGFWHELLNSDAEPYGGSGAGNFGGVRSRPLPAHGRYHSLTLTLPPNGVLFLKREP